MAWSDILGTVGTLAGAVGGGVGGDIGNIISGVGDLAKLGGSIAQTRNAAQQSAQAAGATTQATQQALGLAQQEAARQAQSYKQATGMIPQATAAYQKAVSDLGAYPTLDPAAVQARANQLLAYEMPQTDRDLTAGFSKDLGRLMKAGIDTSTFGVAERGAWADQAASTHQKVYNQAYTDALNYVKDITSGQQAARTAQIKEATDPYTTALANWLDLYKGSGSAATALDVAGKSADQLATMAGAGAQAAQTGAAGQDVSKSFGGIISGIRSLFDGNGTTPSYSTPVPGIYGTDTTGGSMGGHL